MTSQGDSTVIHIGNHNITRFDEMRILLVDGKPVQFTKTEYSIITTLLAGHPVSDRDLASHLFDCQLDFWIKETIVRHIENIRTKLRRKHTGIQVQRITQFGYILVPAA